MYDGNRLRALRKGLGLSQAKVAEKFNIKRETYTRYETGTIIPPADMLVAIAKFFKTTTDYILGLTDDPKLPGEKEADPDIISIQRLRSKLSPKDREKFMKLLKIQFAEDFPEDDK